MPTTRGMMCFSLRCLTAQLATARDVPAGLSAALLQRLRTFAQNVEIGPVRKNAVALATRDLVRDPERLQLSERRVDRRHRQAASLCGSDGSQKRCRPHQLVDVQHRRDALAALADALAIGL